jgi:hypothetical protein
MKHYIARWFISRSIDDPSQPLPAWVTRRLPRDRALREFERNARQLVQRLEQDAAQWIFATSTPSAVRSVPRRGAWAESVPTAAGKVALALGLAAGLLVAISLWRHVPESPPISSAIHSLPLAHAPETSALDLPSWDNSWSLGRRMVDRLAERAEELAATMSLPGSPGLTVNPSAPLESAGVAYGRALATLDQNFQLEQDRIAAEIRGTIHFFAHHLPAQVANQVANQGAGLLYEN